MYISITCPECGKEIEVDEAQAKNLQKCPFCNGELSLGEADEESISVDGAEALESKFWREGDLLVRYTEEGKEVIVPKGVRVTNKLFEGMDVRTVRISDGCEVIESYAFYGCKNLQYVEIGNGIDWIPKNTFCNCENLERIVLPNSSLVLDEDAFNRCPKLTEVFLPSSLESIIVNSFVGCDSLRYNEYQGGRYLGNEEEPYLALMSVDKTVTEFSLHPDTRVIAEPDTRIWTDDAFLGAPNVQKVSLVGKVKVVPMALLNSSTIEEVVIGDGVEEIAFNAICTCKNLRKVVLPDSIREIAHGNFEKCELLERKEENAIYIEVNENLRYILIDTMPNVRKFSIPEETVFVLKWGSSLSEVVVPESVKFINDDSWRENKKLTKMFFKAIDGWKLGGDPIDPKIMKDPVKIVKLLKKTRFGNLIRE